MIGHKKEDIYKMIGDITGHDDPHVANMNLSECVEIINVLEYL